MIIIPKHQWTQKAQTVTLTVIALRPLFMSPCRQAYATSGIRRKVTWSNTVHHAGRENNYGLQDSLPSSGSVHLRLNNSNADWRVSSYDGHKMCAAANEFSRTWLVILSDYLCGRKININQNHAPIIFIHDYSHNERFSSRCTASLCETTAHFAAKN